MASDYPLSRATSPDAVRQVAAVSAGAGDVVAGVAITLREVSVRAAAAAGWDAFAITCNSSMQSSINWLRGYSRRHWRKPRLFEVFEGDHKIGQAVVISERGHRTIHDQIQLSPGSAAAWPRVMTALLGRLGPGRFVTGARWSIDHEHLDELATIPGVTVDTVEPFAVQAVEFGNWPDWESYWRAVSSNARRNAASAEKRIEGLRLEFVQGWRALVQTPALIERRVATAQRKGFNSNPVKESLNLLGTIVSCRNDIVLAFARRGTETLTGKICFEFGVGTFYLGGGSVADSHGAGWYVMRALLERAYHRAPKGRFIMGWTDYAGHDEDTGGGLQRARRSCRVTDWPSAIVAFDYTAPSAVG